MMVKLTRRHIHALRALAGADQPTPWAQIPSRPSASTLADISCEGLAQFDQSGWLITPAGRKALQKGDDNAA